MARVEEMSPGERLGDQAPRLGVMNRQGSPCSCSRGDFIRGSPLSDGGREGRRDAQATVVVHDTSTLEVGADRLALIS